MVRRLILACFLSCVCGIYMVKSFTEYILDVFCLTDRQLTEIGDGLGLSVFLTLFSEGNMGQEVFRVKMTFILALFAGCMVCAALTWKFFMGQRPERLGYGICAAAFFLLGTIAAANAMKMPVFTDEAGQPVSFERLEGERIQGRGVIRQITEKEGTVTLLVDEVKLFSPGQGKLEKGLYVSYDREEIYDKETIQGKEEIQDKKEIQNKEGIRENFWEIPFKSGQVLQFSGKFSRDSRATNPGVFDYREYCWSIGIAGRVEASAEQLRAAGNGSWIRYKLWQLRNVIKERLLQMAQPSDAGILICLLTGEKSELEDYWKELYQDGGIIHLLTISGLHISILGMGVFQLLRKIIGGFFWSSVISGIVTGAFCIMAGSGTSMVRAVICFFLFLLSGYIGRTYDLPTAAAVSGLMILLEHPLLLFQSGFLMTFSCVMGIGFLLPLGDLIFIKPICEDGEKERRNRGCLQKNVQKAVLGAVFLQLSSLPAVLWFQGKVTLAGAFINLVTVPLMGLVLISGLLAVLFSLVSIPAGIFLLGAAHYILCWYEQICLFFRNVPLVSPVTGRPHGWQILLWLLILAGILGTGYRRVLWEQKTLPFFCGILLLPCAVFLLQRFPSADLTIHFLDVGQGDGMVLELPKGEGVFCIDGGSSSQKKLAEYVYEPYFACAGIGQVDCWLITHPDSDHYSGMLDLLEDGFPIKNIFMPLQFQDTDLAVRIEEIHPIQYITAGDQIQSGELQFEILHPAADYSDLDENDASAVVYLVWKEFSVLFTGDMALESEDEVLKALHGRKAEVLKVAHHGSKTATSAEFLKAIAPKTAILSCGKNNRYGHPHKEVLKRLEEAEINYQKTSEVGCIQIVSDGSEYKMTGTVSG